MTNSTSFDKSQTGCTAAVSLSSLSQPNAVSDFVADFIPAFDCLAELGQQRDELLAAMARVLDSGNLILGAEVTAFEKEFAQFVGAEHAVGTSSGTDALIVALRALGIGPGDEVITVANGPVPTVAAIRAVGAVPRFIDVSPDDLQMAPERISQAITSRTRCILPIHLYGWPAPVERIAELCRARGLLLVEDCAQAHGTRLSQQHAGLVGDIGCFSFYPTKNLGALGDAGVCVTRDAALAANLREQTCYGFRSDRIAHREGLNCRLDELQAACLRVRLKGLPHALDQRQRIAAQYRSDLEATPLRLLPAPENSTASWHQFVVRVAQRDAWIKWFGQHRIQVAIHYATPVHLMPAYDWLGVHAGSLPVTEQACREVISLPIYPSLSEPQVQRVVATLRAGIAAGLS
jgi:dTDP-4-amino-4,6-dideoxygalactose transaminase